MLPALPVQAVLGCLTQTLVHEPGARGTLGPDRNEPAERATATEL